MAGLVPAIHARIRANTAMCHRKGLFFQFIPALTAIALTFVPVSGYAEQKPRVISNEYMVFHQKPGGVVFQSNEFNGGYKIQFAPAGSNKPARMYLLHPPFTDGQRYVTTGGTFDKMFESIPVPIGFDPTKAYKLEYFGLDLK
jgi:hypothetical protein